MTWAAAAVLLAVVLVVVAVALRRTIRSLQWVVDDLQREAGPLLAELERCPQGQPGPRPGRRPRRGGRVRSLLLADTA